MNKVTLSGHILVPPDDLQQIREALPAHIANTCAETGCILFKVEENSTETGRFDVYEEFDSREAYEEHQRRVRESDWGQISSNVTRHYTVDGLDA